MTEPSPRDWLQPRLVALMADAEAAGIGRDVSVAVITDLINGALSTAAPAPADEDWNQDIGQPDSAVNIAGPGVDVPEIDPLAGQGTRNPLWHTSRRW